MALALGACGGSDDASGGDDDATALLDRAFEQPIPSADVELDLQLEVDGAAGLDDPVRVVATGPYVRSEGKLPQLDMDVEIGAQGAGQAIRTGLLSTGDRVFLRFADVYFEQPRDEVAATNRRLERDRGRGDEGGSLSELGLDPRSWIVDASVAGEEEIGGVQTRHVTGTLDVEALVVDLNRLLETSAGAAGGQAPEPLGEADVERLAESVENPTFDVYVGEDDIVRRISTRLDVSVPEGERQDVGGVTGAAIRFSAELADVDGDQQIEAPRSSRPIAELTEQLGGLAGLAGGTLGGGGLGGGDLGGGEAPEPEQSVPGEDAAGSAAEAFERYGECLEQARPDDVAALDRCADLLN